jgi:transcriptional regulator
MYGTDTKSQFLELRAKGWSLARIAEHLKMLVALIRAEIRKVCQAPPVVEVAIAKED